MDNRGEFAIFIKQFHTLNKIIDVLTKTMLLMKCSLNEENLTSDEVFGMLFLTYGLLLQNVLLGFCSVWADG
jgi:hypothetical protein